MALDWPEFRTNTEWSGGQEVPTSAAPAYTPSNQQTPTLERPDQVDQLLL